DATLAITREEHMHPLPCDAISTSRLAWSQRTVDDRKDDDPRLGHATASTMSRLIGQEPSVADVSTHASTMSWNQTLPGAPCDLSGDRRTTEPILVRSFSFSWVASDQRSERPRKRGPPYCSYRPGRVSWCAREDSN